MAKISPGIMTTGVTRTSFIDRLLVFRILGLFNRNLSAGGKERPIPAISRGKDAIEEVDPEYDGLEDILRCAHAHQVSRGRFRQQGQGSFQNTDHFGFWLAHAEPSNGKTLKIHLNQIPGARFT